MVVSSADRRHTLAEPHRPGALGPRGLTRHDKVSGHEEVSVGLAVDHESFEDQVVPADGRAGSGRKRGGGTTGAGRSRTLAAAGSTGNRSRRAPRASTAPPPRTAARSRCGRWSSQASGPRGSPAKAGRMEPSSRARCTGRRSSRGKGASPRSDGPTHPCLVPPSGPPPPLPPSRPRLLRATTHRRTTMLAEHPRSTRGQAAAEALRAECAGPTRRRRRAA